MSDNKIGRMGGQWEGAGIPNATPVVIAMNGAPLPCTVTLNSTAAGRLIEISTDGGVNYNTFTPTITATPQLIAALTYPVSHVRLTGNASGVDTWSIR